jgi:hypothetical protein
MYKIKPNRHLENQYPEGVTDRSHRQDFRERAESERNEEATESWSLR